MTRASAILVWLLVHSIHDLVILNGQALCLNKVMVGQIFAKSGREKAWSAAVK